MTLNSHPGFEHEDCFRRYCLIHGVRVAVENYVDCMWRIAREVGYRLGPSKVRDESDIQRIIGNLRDPALNDRHRANFRSVLRKYTQMVGANFEGRFSSTSIPIDSVANDLAEPGPALRTQVTVSRIIRDSSMAKALKQRYRGQCQLCGGRLEIGPGEFYVEAHHLQPLGAPHHGHDDEANLLCVCPNCHVKLDFNAVRLDPAQFKVSLHTVGREYLDYHNKLCR